MNALAIVFPRRGLTVPEALERAADKAAPRRFTGEPPTAFGDLDADAIDERLELERDMYDDMVRRSA